MRATVPEVAITQATVGEVDVGQVTAGPLTVGRLSVSGMNADISTGRAELTGLRVTLGLKVVLVWKVTVGIEHIASWSWSGEDPLNETTVTIGLGNPTLPGLANLHVDVGDLAIDGVQVALEPLRGLRLGALLAEQVRVQDLTLPGQDVQLSGLGLQRLTAEGVDVPDATASRATVSRVRGDAFPVGTVNLPSIGLPEAAMADIRSSALDVSNSATAELGGTPDGPLSVALRVTASAALHADELHIAGVRFRGTSGTISLENVTLPYELTDVTLGALGITRIAVPKVEVG